MKILNLLSLTGIFLFFACQESQPQPELSEYPKLIEMEFFSGMKDSIRITYDKEGRLSELIFDEIEGRKMGRRFEYNREGKLLRQIQNSAFFAAIALGLIEKTFEYEYDAEGKIHKEVLVEDRRLWKPYGGGDEWEENQVFDEAIPVLSFSYQSDGRLQSLQRFSELNYLPQETRMSYPDSDTSLSARYFKADAQNPQQLTNWISLHLLEVDNKRNPFYELSKKTALPLIIYLPPGMGLNLVHSLTSQNPTFFKKTQEIAPFQEFNSRFTYTYNEKDLPEFISRPFQSASEPIAYRFEY